MNSGKVCASNALSDVHGKDIFRDRGFPSAEIAECPRCHRRSFDRERRLYLPPARCRRFDGFGRTTGQRKSYESRILLLLFFLLLNLLLLFIPGMITIFIATSNPRTTAMNISLTVSILSLK